MRRLAIAALLAALLAPPALTAAWYGGAAAGLTSLGHTVRDFDDGSILIGDVDDEDYGWKLFGGYRFLPFLGVEAGYVDLVNDSDSTPSFVGFSDGSGPLYRRGPVSVDIDDPTGFYGAAVGRLPIGSRFALFAKLGLFNWSADVTTINLGVAQTIGDSGTSTMAGAGFEAKILPLLRLRAEWERYAEIVRGDVDLISIGIVLGVPLP